MPILRLPLLIFGSLLPLTACFAGEYGPDNHIWQLAELNGQPYEGRANITFPEAGQFAGQAPCNRYFGSLEDDYPAFKTGPIGATRMACANLEEEQRFFTALEAATTADLTAETLTLSGPNGPLLIFTAAE